MTTAPSVSQTNRHPALDGLRSLVLLIVFFHYLVAPARGWDGWSLQAFMLVGLLGVTALDVFFVLSGFLITNILLTTKGLPGYFRTFFIRRLVRIVPLYYGFLLCYLVLLPSLSMWDAPLRPADQLYYWGYAVNIAYAFNWPLAPYTGHLWTLSLEEQFYLAWPVVIWLCSLKQARRVCLACIIAAPLVRWAAIAMFPDTILFYSFTLARMDGLAMGALIAVYWQDKHRLERFTATIRLAAVGAAFVASAIVVLALQQPTLSLEPGIGIISYLTASVYVAAGIVLTFLQPSRRIWHRVVASWPLRQIGIYSYAIYLLHDPLSYTLHRFQLLQRPSLGASLQEALVYFVVMTAITVAASATTWQFIEKPLLRLRPPSPATAPSLRPTARQHDGTS